MGDSRSQEQQRKEGGKIKLQRKGCDGIDEGYIYWRTPRGIRIVP